MLGGLPPVAVSLEPADCPTEAQLQRVLAALGAKLVPFGSPARATVFAQRDGSGEWTLVLGRPGFNEKRKVVLAGGCDEQATALGAIIERFARPVLIPTRDPPPPSPGVDAGVRPAPEPVDAGAPAPSPSPPPILVFVEPPDAGAPEPEPPPEPQPERFAVGARAGVGLSTSGFSAIAGLWGEYRWKRLSFGAGVDYYGPMRVQQAIEVVRIEQCRPHFFARLKALSFLSLEAGVALSAAWSQGQARVNDGDAMYHAGLNLGLLASFPVGPVELWGSLRGWYFIANSQTWQLDSGEDFRFPNWFGDLMLGISLKL